MEKLELAKRLQEAELNVLKSQINPHFLFNALNNIRSLVRLDPEKARHMITNISDFIRYILDAGTQKNILLSEELHIVDQYLMLESIQYGERMQVQMEVNESTLNRRIPPMVIQLLVENAVKHGLGKTDQPVLIKVKTHLKNEKLNIEVINTGRIKKQTSEGGIGLKNLVGRMKMFFGESFSFSIKNTENNTVTATIQILQNA
ncbi:MAG: histidine kinase [Ekhidna sp.]|nr:histidine kinase [Ekhidna sp.]